MSDKDNNLIQILILYCYAKICFSLIMTYILWIVWKCSLYSQTMRDTITTCIE